MSEWRSWEARDPLEVLIRKGEGCDNCRYYEPWKENVATCAKGKKPGRRCDDWKHENWESGN